MRLKTRNHYQKKNGATINAVECVGCTIKTDGINVVCLGLKNIKIEVSKSEVKVVVRSEKYAKADDGKNGQF